MKLDLLYLIKKAMLSRNSFELGVLRLMKTEFVNFENSANAAKLTEVEESKIIIKMIKQRKDSVEQYNKANRSDLAEKELIINDNKIAIDLGINNLCAVTNNINEEYFIINGKPLKSINQYYNKMLAKYKSDLPKNVYTSNKIRKLTNKRNDKIKCELHKVTKYLVSWCEEHNVSNIIIGYNKEWKNECNMGKKNNQKFIQIPYLDLLNTLKYKARLVGIDIILTE